MVTLYLVYCTRFGLLLGKDVDNTRVSTLVLSGIALLIGVVLLIDQLREIRKEYEGRTLTTNSSRIHLLILVVCAAILIIGYPLVIVVLLGYLCVEAAKVLALFWKWLITQLSLYLPIIPALIKKAFSNSD